MDSNNIEPIRVVARCRPLLPREIQDKRLSIINADPLLAEITVTNPEATSKEDPKTFSFDHVLSPETSQSTVYNEIGFPLVDSVLRGYNGTILAYGQTGAGKTYTMQGYIGSEELKGITIRAIEQIFNYIKSTPERQFLVKVSYLELYNERIQDLLVKNSKDEIQIREKPGLGIYVENLLSLPVENAADALQKLQLGNQNRAIAMTRMSACSSRSHTIFSVTVESSEILPNGKQHVKVGKLNLVDLAGSERSKKTGATGEILREAMHINMSLTVFRNIISALTDPKARFVPYRDSKLTRLLQESLGRNSNTVMIANIGPADWNYDETRSTLRLVARAKYIINKPMIFEEVREIREEIEESKAQLNQPQEKQKVDHEKVVIEELKTIEEACQQQEELEKLKKELEEKTLVEQKFVKLLKEQEAELEQNIKSIAKDLSKI